jgi:hypothetical protein
MKNPTKQASNQPPPAILDLSRETDVSVPNLGSQPQSRRAVCGCQQREGFCVGVVEVVTRHRHGTEGDMANEEQMKRSLSRGGSDCRYRNTAVVVPQFLG